MPLLDPEVRKALNKIRQALNEAPDSVRDIPDVSDLDDTMSAIKPLKRRLRRELKEVLELLDGEEHPQLSGIADLRQAILSAMQHLKRPGGPPIATDDTDG